MTIDEHFRKSLAAFTAELESEPQGGIMSEVVRLAKLYGFTRGYKERDDAFRTGGVE